MSNEVVYVLGSPGSNVVKIGRTTNLTKRVADIQRMSPVPLVALWTHPGGHELETQLHRHFASSRSHGEWFTFDSGDPVQLVQDAVSRKPWSAPKPPVPAVARVKKVKPVPPPRVPISQRNHALDPVLEERYEAVLRAISEVPDPIEQYKEAESTVATLKQEFRRMRMEAVLELKQEGRTWREVGEILGVTGARAEQMSRGSR